jgi:hypothetical protein
VASGGRAARVTEKEKPDFEEVVAALLKVDPKGLSGKHKAAPAKKKAKAKKKS